MKACFFCEQGLSAFKMNGRYLHHYAWKLVCCTEKNLEPSGVAEEAAILYEPKHEVRYQRKLEHDRMGKL